MLCLIKKQLTSRGILLTVIASLAVVYGARRMNAGDVTNIAPVTNRAWGENIGWLDWRDAAAGEQGARIYATFLAGYVWAENTGWINLGNGRPGDGLHYANSDGSSFGVNIDPADGSLFGLAWAENLGWINFDTRVALQPFGQHARIDRPVSSAYRAGRLRGYAWGENIGWINLDDAVHYVEMVPLECGPVFADADADGDVDQADFAVMQACASGVAAPAMLVCACFDRPASGLPLGDNDVDGEDWDRFELCAGSPGVMANPACDD